LTSFRYEATVVSVGDLRREGGRYVEGRRQLTLAIDGGPDADAREVSELTAHLRQRLLELDVDKVELVRSTEIPADAKPGDAITLGSLLVTVAPAALTAVIGLLKDWLVNRPVQTAKVTIDGDSIELTNVSTADLERLAQAFVEKHAKP
jgi:hypothetical protein